MESTMIKIRREYKLYKFMLENRKKSIFERELLHRFNYVIKRDITNTAIYKYLERNYRGDYFVADLIWIHNEDVWLYEVEKKLFKMNGYHSTWGKYYLIKEGIIPPRLLGRFGGPIKEDRFLNHLAGKLGEVPE
jgi:hypothetical protein